MANERWINVAEHDVLRLESTLTDIEAALAAECGLDENTALRSPLPGGAKVDERNADAWGTLASNLTVMASKMTRLANLIQQARRKA